jgi:hypothetical protein
MTKLDTSMIFDKWKPMKPLIALIEKLRIANNDCPMCGEQPMLNNSICQECRDYCNNGSDQL